MSIKREEQELKFERWFEKVYIKKYPEPSDVDHEEYTPIAYARWLEQAREMWKNLLNEDEIDREMP